MVEAGVVGHAARPVIGDDDGSDLARGYVSFVESDDDSVVAAPPHRRRGDLVYETADKLVALGDQPTLLHGSRVVGVHAPGRSAVHVVALIGDDVAEVRN